MFDRIDIVGNQSANRAADAVRVALLPLLPSLPLCGMAMVCGSEGHGG